jgi:hypothetical protein
MIRLMISLFFAGILFAPSKAELKEEVRRTETGFAKTMAERDHSAFVTFLDPETVFMSNGVTTRGSRVVAGRWVRFFDGPTPGFPGRRRPSRCSIPETWR